MFIAISSQLAKAHNFWTWKYCPFWTDMFEIKIFEVLKIFMSLKLFLEHI
jgi:hypothetical protein